MSASMPAVREVRLALPPRRYRRTATTSFARTGLKMTGIPDTVNFTVPEADVCCAPAGALSARAAKIAAVTTHLIEHLRRAAFPSSDSVLSESPDSRAHR